MGVAVALLLLAFAMGGSDKPKQVAADDKPVTKLPPKSVDVSSRLSGVESKQALLGTKTLANRQSIVDTAHSVPGGLEVLDTSFFRPVSTGGPTPANISGRYPVGTIVISDHGSLEAAAKGIASAIMARISGKTSAELDLMIRNAKQTFLFSSKADMERLTKAWAIRLTEIGGLGTSGPCNLFGCGPTRWVPANAGPFAEGRNQYTVPSRLVGDLHQDLKRHCEAITLGGNVYYTAYHFVFEYGILFAFDTLYRATHAKDPTALQVFIEGAMSALGAAATGAIAGGGPWGALTGAAASVAVSVGKAIDAWSKLDERERGIAAKIKSVLRDFEAQNKWKSFLEKEGYGFTTKEGADKAKKYPEHLFAQSSEHPLGIESGTYPGVGLWMYRGDDDVGFMFSLTGADIVRGSHWNAPIRGRKNGLEEVRS